MEEKKINTNTSKLLIKAQNTTEILTKAQNAILLAELIGDIKYKNHKRAINLLEMYAHDTGTSKEAKVVLLDLASKIALRFSKNKIWLKIFRFFKWF